jgi:hypothetical protein
MTTNDREVPHETRVFVDIVVVPGAGSLQAVIGRDAQFAMAPGTFQLMAYEQGRRLVAVMSILTRNAVNIVMHRDVARERGVTEKSPLADKVRALKGLKLSGFTRERWVTKSSSTTCSRLGSILRRMSRLSGSARPRHCWWPPRSRRRSVDPQVGA